MGRAQEVLLMNGLTDEPTSPLVGMRATNRSSGNGINRVVKDRSRSGCLIG